MAVMAQLRHMVNDLDSHGHQVHKASRKTSKIVLVLLKAFKKLKINV